MVQILMKGISVLSVLLAAGSADDEYHRSLASRSGPTPKNTNEVHNRFWVDNAQKTLTNKIARKLNTNKAKNIIFFLGDGMSMHTVTAARIFDGREEGELSFDKFPYFGLSKTYCVDSQVADSACSATAYLSGVKGNIGTIGVNAKVLLGICASAEDKSTHTDSIGKWAQDSGKATGIVTTARVTHASPAGVYAHTADRDWENNDLVVKDGCDPNVDVDIAQQLVYSDVGRNLNVVLGGGRAEFRDKSIKDEDGEPGYRTDGKNLINEWIDTHENSQYVYNKTGLLSVDLGKTDHLLGLFSSDHCSYHGDIQRNGLTKTQPTLTEMTETAIKLLRKESNGFFLFVEGARIDMAHHDNKARKALEDTVEMARAIQLAKDMTSEEDTLIVVTSDHSHVMTINGYPDRGDDILKLSGTHGSGDRQKLDNGNDGLPYTILSYANGPGFTNAYKEGGGGRRDITKDNFNDPNYQYAATVPLKSETHGGDDVGIYAVGPYAHTFVGNYEQSYLPLLMAQAAKIGPFDGTRSAGDRNQLTIGLILFCLLRFLL